MPLPTLPCRILIAAALLLSGMGTCSYGQAAKEIRSKIKEAAAQNSAGGAGVLCGLLNTVIGKCNQHRKNSKILREWEELANDIQDAVGRMNSPEALGMLAKGLKSMNPQAQAVIAAGLKKLPATPELIKAASGSLRNANYFQAQVACIDLLGKYKARPGVPSILRLLKNSNPICIQISACRALAKIPAKESIGALITYLGSLKGSQQLRDEATSALQSLTGQKFGPDASTWSGWWEKNKNSFDVESVGVSTYKTPLAKEEPVTYYEIPIIEDRVVFLIDKSGSMKAGGSPNRMETAKSALKDLVARLPEKTLFNIIFFSNKVERWSPNTPLLNASKNNKKAALAFIDSIEHAGSTATMAAVEEALQEISLANGVEALFLITDGAPNPMIHSGVRSVNDYPRGMKAIQRRIRFLNQFSKVKINTVGIYTGDVSGPLKSLEKHMRSFLENVAKENGGEYKEVK